VASATAAAAASESLKEHGRIFANPDAGPGAVSVEDLSELFAGHDIEVCEPDELGGRIEAIAGHGTLPAFIGVAGGDGTVRCAAGAAVRLRTSAPLLPIAAGTRNHFASDLGMRDVDAAAEVADRGTQRSVDVGSVNGEIFVNNSSIGLYPSLVADREDHESRLPKRLANVVAAWHQLRRGHRIWVEVDGARRRVWTVFIGNNCYGDSMRDLADRERLDEGVLDVRIAHAKGRFSRLRIAGSVLVGRLPRSPLVERRRTSEVVIDAGGPVEVALDGEVLTLSSPLEYRSCPRALRVLAPRDHDQDV